MVVVVVWRELEKQFLSNGQEYHPLYVASFHGFAESWMHEKINFT